MLSLAIKPKKPSTLTYQYKNVIGQEQSMEGSKKKFQKIFPNHSRLE